MSVTVAFNPLFLQRRGRAALVPTIAGAISINPADLRLSPIPPPVLLERVVIDRQSI